MKAALRTPLERPPGPINQIKSLANTSDQKAAVDVLVLLFFKNSKSNECCSTTVTRSIKSLSVICYRARSPKDRGAIFVALVLHSCP